MKRDKETRLGVSLSYRSAETEGEVSTLYGYIAKWNEPSLLICENGRRFVEIIHPGAFAKSLQNNDIHALWNHSYATTIGRNLSGSLTLKEDEVGLYFELIPANTSAGRDVLELVRRGDVSGCSFGAIAVKDDWTPQGDGTYLHDVYELDLLEVTVTPIPAYPQTEVSARSLEQAIELQESKITRKPISRDLAKKILEIL